MTSATRLAQRPDPATAGAGRSNLLLPLWLAAIWLAHLGGAAVSVITYDPSIAIDRLPSLGLGATLVGALYAARAGRWRIVHNAFDYIGIFLAMIAFDGLMSRGDVLGLAAVDQILRSTAFLSTTAAVNVEGLDTLPPAFTFHAAALQMLGAVWFIQLTTVAIPAHVFTSLAASDDIALSEQAAFSALLDRLWLTIPLVAAGLLAFGTVGFWIIGTPIADGLIFAAALVSLGGHVNYDASMGFYGAPVHWFAILLMLAGATNWLLHARAVARLRPATYWRDGEFRLFIAIIAVAGLAATATTLWSQFGFETVGPTLSEVFDQLTEGVFFAVSISTTTGVAVADYGLHPGLVGMALLLSVIGGCAGSSSGGIKIARLSAQFRVFGLILSGRRFTRIGRNTMSLSALQFLQIYMTIFLGLILLSVAVLGLMGLDLVTALSVTVSNLTNLGVGLGPVVGPAGSYADLSELVKLWTVLLMILGRIELGLVFVFLSARYWLSPETIGAER